MADPRPRVGEGVKRLGIDLGNPLRREVFDQEAHRAGGSEPRVDPAAKADDGKRPPQVQCLEILEYPQVAVAFAHAASIAVRCQLTADT